jgi:hypothetical protein
MTQYAFHVFGRTLAIERVGDRWHSHWTGVDGKRRKAELAIPSDVAREELAQYLYDIYHENATPTNGDVFEVVAGQTRDNPEWPFDSPPDAACVTVKAIVEGARPVLMATRDTDDGAWQFLTGDAFDKQEAMRVSLRSMVERDPTLRQLADMQPGWMAWRSHRDAPWTRQAEATQADQ